MKLAYITLVYDDYIDQFYRINHTLINDSYSQQKSHLDYDAFGWADFWSNALNPIGYEVLEITVNIRSLQIQWAKENNCLNSQVSLEYIALQQVKQFQPDILWFDNYDTDLLREICQEVSSIKLVLGWSGSAVLKTNIWKYIDLVLSYAPESVAYFQSNGIKSQQIHHAFDPRVNNRLKFNSKAFETCFIGQILRKSDFHLYREKLLEELCFCTQLLIFSSSANYVLKNTLKQRLKNLLSDLIDKLSIYIEKYKLDNNTLFKQYIREYVNYLQAKLSKPVSQILIPFLKPAVFGLEMFQTLANSKIALNIHADSSPLFASNMRLFETTGVGTCLLTDWKTNIHELFEPDYEVVTYRSVEECIEKIAWLLDHPQESETIAKAGQLRTLKDHTFAQRSIQLDEIIKQNI